MARPKLKEDQKKVSVSFALDKEFNDILLREIPAGQRSAWLCGVVISSLEELNKLGTNDLTSSSNE